MNTFTEVHYDDEGFSLALGDHYANLRQWANGFFSNNLITKNKLELFNKIKTSNYVELFIIAEQIGHYDIEQSINHLMSSPEMWCGLDIECSERLSRIAKEMPIVISDQRQHKNHHIAYGFLPKEYKRLAVLEKTKTARRLLIIEIKNKYRDDRSKQSTLGFNAIRLSKVCYTENDIVDSFVLNGTDENPFFKLLIFYSAILLGLIKTNINASFIYARTRQTFGKAIIHHQAVSLRLANMLTDYEATKLLALSIIVEAVAAEAVVTVNTVTDIDRSKSHSKEIDQLIKQLTNMERLIGKEAIQIAGAHGYVRGAPAADSFIVGNNLILIIQYLAEFT